MIPGYDLGELLGRGRHSEVYLAVPSDSGHPVLDRVVLKLYENGAAATHAAQVARVWQLLESAHCPQFLDEVHTETHTAIVCSWAPRPPLSELLAQRPLRPGEAVTILAPLVQLLSGLHENGETHGELDPRHVVFGTDGEPVLLGWGSAEAGRSALDDVLQFVTLCREVLNGCPGLASDAPFLAQQADALATSGVVPPEFYRDAERRLFELAEARAVDPIEPYDWNAEGGAVLAAVDAEVDEIVAGQAADRRIGGRLRLAGRAATQALSRSPASDRDSRRSGSPRAAVERLARVAREGGVPLWPRSAMRVRIRTLAVALLVCGVATAGTLASVPPHGPGAPQVESSKSTPGMVDATADASASAAIDATADASAAAAAIAGDDPVAALGALITRREDCLEHDAVSCLQLVDQPESPALARDQLAYGEFQRTGVAGWLVITIDRGPGSLRQRDGDAATVVVTLAAASLQPQPAAALLVKSAAGWRLREVFVPPP